MFPSGGRRKFWRYDSTLRGPDIRSLYTYQLPIDSIDSIDREPPPVCVLAQLTYNPASAAIAFQRGCQSKGAVQKEVGMKEFAQGPKIDREDEIG